MHIFNKNGCDVITIYYVLKYFQQQRVHFAIVSYHYLPTQTTTLFIYTAPQDEPLEPQNGTTRFHATFFAGVFIHFEKNVERKRKIKH